MHSLVVIENVLNCVQKELVFGEKRNTDHSESDYLPLVAGALGGWG